MPWTAKCDECDYVTPEVPWVGDLQLPLSAHRIETGHQGFTEEGEDPAPAEVWQPEEEA